jgi:hypothetical protein
MAAHPAGKMRGVMAAPPRSLVAATSLAAILALSLGQATLNAKPPSAIQRAIAYLYATQLRAPLDVSIDGRRVVDFPGDWPQSFALADDDTVRVRDVSPFTVVFIHHALARLSARQADLSAFDLELARTMRRRAIRFVKTFESPAGAPDAGTFAFWPYDRDPATPGPLLTLLLTSWLRGPVLGGQRVPVNLPAYPSTMAIPSDADVTSTTYASLLDDAAVDGGTGSDVRFERFFADWRDLGIVPRRVNPPWLVPASGTFLTWLTYRAQPLPLYPNDVDLVVNANVLYALGRYRRLNVPGIAEAIASINLVTALGLHRQRLAELTQYYPDNFVFQYAVSRAFHEGRILPLEPAVRILADDLERSAIVRDDATVYWDHGDPQLNTAFAVLTLLNAGRRTPLVARAVDYLLAEQGPLGGFDAATFFLARTGSGVTFHFASAPFTTAMAIEALARYQDAH